MSLRSTYDSKSKQIEDFMGFKKLIEFDKLAHQFYKLNLKLLFQHYRVNMIQLSFFFLFQTTFDEISSDFFFFLISGKQTLHSSNSSTKLSLTPFK